ncbi:NCS1 family nucleobase:cation symporter-1 [Candidatus Sumerlaeota bacterium]|nr:NCS1 family nucleobase:cation symporter-1 [Candidatus Sumerlaeota bacterium]
MSSATHPADSSLSNEDLAPVPPEKRTWSLWSVAALWVGMAVCISTYNLAAGMIEQGMTWWQAVLTVALGNIIVCIPMILNAHPGTKYGIPFPVLVRASFGTLGANIPAIMRALVACGWFGIQTWIGGAAIYTMYMKLTGGAPATEADLLPVLGISAGQFLCFMIFWVINYVFILIGTESIRWLENFSAPFLIIVGVILMFWAVNKAGGWGPTLAPETTARLRKEHFSFWALFFPSLTAMVGYWATLSLNIPDFSRYVKSQKDQIAGQLMGLPTTMTLYSFIGIVVTCASIIIYNEAIWDPVVLLSKFHSLTLVVLSLVALAVATLTTNIAANVVSPANDFANIAPKHISFKVGGTITAIIGILMMPWKLYNDPGAYIFIWLVGYSALLGSIAGVMLADYYVIRGKHLDVDQLYRRGGIYAYTNGFNFRAIIAMVSGILPCVPGFIRKLVGIATLENRNILDSLYDYGWFLSLTIAVVVYLVITPKQPSPIGAST